MSNSQPSLSVKIEENSPESDQNKSGKWTEEENLRYVLFLDKNKGNFKSKLKKRKVKLFEKMSQFIGSRTMIQCRTHHQKYENKFGDSKTIIAIYKEEIGVSKYKKYKKQFFGESPKSNLQVNTGKIERKNEEIDEEQMKEKEKADVGTQTDIPWQWLLNYSQERFGMGSWDGMNCCGYPHYF